MSAICPYCEKPVPESALEGLCPECMFKAGLLGQTGKLGRASASEGQLPLSDSPGPEEIAPLFPQLEVLDFVGRGGMGAVYKARQPWLERLVAVKVLIGERQDRVGRAAIAERFQREAWALARLSHPNIVAVYDVGETAGYPFLLMEYVDGHSLRQLLQTGKCSLPEALAIVSKLCDALHYAHVQGVVHRDIKPENILIDKLGRVKIADFGLAKILGSPSAPQLALTQERQVLGTPQYMAPEQIEKPLEVDHRADIYSLGVVFYELLTGELPLGRFRPPSEKAGVDPRLDNVVLQALEKEPERRCQQAREIQAAVQCIVATARKDPLRPDGTDSPSAKRSGLSKMARLVGGLVLGLVLIGTVVVLVADHQGAQPNLAVPAAPNAKSRKITYEVAGLIDSTDLLIIRGSELQWHHVGAGAVVGLQNGGSEPTTISSTVDGSTNLDAVAWTPTWPQPSQGKLRNDAFSSVFKLTPALPSGKMTISVTALDGRGAVSVAQLPNAANNWTLIVQFADGRAGAALLRARISVEYDGKPERTAPGEPSQVVSDPAKVFGTWQCEASTSPAGTYENSPAFQRRVPIQAPNQSRRDG